jgi:hypothetical protein
MSSNSLSFEALRAQHTATSAAAEDARAKTEREHRAAITKANRACAAVVDASAKALEAEVQRRAVNVQSRTLAALCPLLREYTAEPSHKLAAQIAIVFRPLDEEHLTLTGQALPDHIVAFAFAANAVEADERAISFFSRADAFHAGPTGVGQSSWQVIRALRDASPLPTLRNALDTVDMVSQMLVATYKSAPSDVNRERFDVVIKGGTSAAREAALAAIATREQEAINEKNAVFHACHIAERNKREEEGRIVNNQPLHSIWPEDIEKDLAARGDRVVQVDDAALWGGQHPCPPASAA